MPQANSTTSSPRVTSPSASESTLPCSAVMSAAMSSLRSLSSSRKRNSTWVRLVSDGAAPARGPRLLGGRDDLVDVVSGGEVEGTGLLTRRGVEDRAGALGGAVPGLTGDVVGDAGGSAHDGSFVLDALWDNVCGSTRSTATRSPEASEAMPAVETAVAAYPSQAEGPTEVAGARSRPTPGPRGRMPWRTARGSPPARCHPTARRRRRRARWSRPGRRPADDDGTALGDRLAPDLVADLAVDEHLVGDDPAAGHREDRDLRVDDPGSGVRGRSG